MKKIKLLLLFVFITTMSFGQTDDVFYYQSNNSKPKTDFSINSVSMGGGVSYFQIDTKEASNVGFNIMFTIKSIGNTIVVINFFISIFYCTFVV